MAEDKRQQPHSAGRTAAKWFGIAAASVVGLVLLTLCALSLYLTPERLTSIINREASQYLEADVQATNVRYTLWRSFPRFDVQTDSIVVRSRTLDSIPDSIRRQLPANADFLGAVKSFSGSINVVDLFIRRYVIHDVKADGLRVNLVSYNDSINNYEIVPSSGAGLKKVPYFSAHFVDLQNPGGIDYLSVSSDTKASLDLRSLTLRRLGNLLHPDNDYALALAGKVTARSAGIDILHDFPFDLNGKVRLRFDPFGFSLSDYRIDLGRLRTTLSMSLGMGENPRIESFDYRISKVNLLNLLGYIPKEYIPDLQGLNADMQVEASARLLSSWSLQSGRHPTKAVDFTVPEGTISNTMSTQAPNGAPGFATYDVAHSRINAQFLFDGADPARSALTVRPFRLSSSGVDVSVGAEVSHLTASPLIRADVGIEAELGRVAHALPGGVPADISGRLSSRSDISFTLAALSREALAEGFRDIRTSTGFTVTALAVKGAGAGRFTIGRLTGTALAGADALTPDAVVNPHSQINVDIPSADAETGSGTVRLSGFGLTVKTDITKSVSAEDFRNGLPMTVGAGAAGVEYTSAPSASTGRPIDVRLSGLAVKDVATRAAANSLAGILADGLDISAATATVSDGRNSLTLHGPALAIEVTPRPGTHRYFPESLPATGGKGGFRPLVELRHTDTPACAAAMSHTPELLAVNLPDEVKGVLDRWRIKTALSFSSADLRTPGVDQPGALRDLALSIDEDAVTLHTLSIDMEGMHGTLAGSVSNIRGFLLSPPSESNPVRLDFDATVDHIDINALARAYAASKGGIDRIQVSHPATRADSVTVLIPRNISAGIRARVGGISYTNLDLTDIGADIRIAGGVADIRHVGLASSFGTAALALRYDSSDIEALRASGSLALKDIDITGFFRKFPSILRMAPEMKNLTGYLGLTADFKAGIFPDMAVNVPSADVGMHLSGRSLVLRQSRFIRRITRMMLIRSAAPIHIADLDINASIHDNLLQLYPFDFEFDRYKLHMLGVNNMNGRLYYHMAVEESPVHIPFAINIEGMFSHPKLRFGDVHYDIRRGEEITERDQQEESFNLVRLARDFMGMFIKTGAEYSDSGRRIR